LGQPVSLLDAFNATEVVKGPSCGIAKILAQLSDDDRQLVQGWLAASKDEVGHAHIARTLTRVGHRVDGSSVGRHRRGECLC
jgi:hypothetical protein